MTPLRMMLALNGIVFLVRAALNLRRPTNFYAHDDAAATHIDTVRVVGWSYAALGTIQLGVSLADARAVQITSAASALFAGGIAAQAATQGPGPDAFHRIRFAAAAENAAVATLYTAGLIRAYRARR